MKLFLSQEFKFDSAHNLINYRGKCEKLHGHTYRLRVTLTGTADPESGMLMDFGFLKERVMVLVIDRLDHSYINDTVEISTAENIAGWIWKTLEGPLRGETYEIYEITLWETESSSVTLRLQDIQ
ncbi:MAG: 6-carboxytetrahydropterin synthase QueD [Brevinematales bacterium]|jgi:6-pyruvoyltetrahydropterin/6-carboxytetrahydropterin synthase